MEDGTVLVPTEPVVVRCSRVVIEAQPECQRIRPTAVGCGTVCAYSPCHSFCGSSCMPIQRLSCVVHATRAMSGAMAQTEGPETDHTRGFNFGVELVLNYSF